VRWPGCLCHDDAQDETAPSMPSAFREGFMSACMGCCTSLLYGTTGASKITDFPDSSLASEPRGMIWRCGPGTLSRSPPWP
jgi:hypothetical protein